MPLTHFLALIAVTILALLTEWALARLEGKVTPPGTAQA